MQGRFVIVRRIQALDLEFKQIKFIKASYVQYIIQYKADDVKLTVCRKLGVFGSRKLTSPKCYETRVPAFNRSSLPRPLPPFCLR